MPLWISVSDNFTFAVVLNQLIFEAKDFVSGLVLSPKLFMNIPSQNICTLYSLRISILLLFYFSLEKRQDYLVGGDPDHENQCLLTELTAPRWTQKEFTVFLICHHSPKSECLWWSSWCYVILRLTHVVNWPNHFPLKFLWAFFFLVKLYLNDL